MKFLILFAALVAELGLLLELSERLGTLVVLAWVVFTLAAGIWLLRSQARGIAQAAGGYPGSLRALLASRGGGGELRVLHAHALLALAGVLLALPGPMTDLVAGLLLVPRVRGWLFARSFGVPREAAGGVRAGRRYRAERADVEVIPPGMLATPFRPRRRIIDVE
jgi:UPF0716 protein FxsA